jgi:CBS domain-containing protein
MADAFESRPEEPLAELGALLERARSVQQQIARADGIEPLRRAALQIPGLTARLHDAGCAVAPIAALVQGLSTPLFERAWRLVAPAELVANSCLFVMGSEGRGEQILKTDQDNGLVLRDAGADPAATASACQRFSEALRAFGYPDCPGGIMVSNPSWRQGVDDFSRTARRWLLMPDAEGLMSLAIFLDARPVCGDPALLERVRDEIFQLSAGSDAMLSRFAAAVESFADSSGWWNRWLPNADHGRSAVDLKKAGMFPLVHGVRSLALALQVRETSTVGRIDALRALGGVLAPEVARDLVDSLNVFMELKLKTGLARRDGESATSNLVQLDRLATLDRSRLDAALGVVKQFKAALRHRFHLDALS